MPCHRAITALCSQPWRQRCQRVLCVGVFEGVVGEYVVADFMYQEKVGVPADGIVGPSLAASGTCSRSD